MDKFTVADIAELQRGFDERMSLFERELLTTTGATGAQQPPNIAALATEFAAFKTFVWKALKDLKSQVEACNEALDAIETRSGAKVILLHGVEEARNEDLSSKVTELIRTKLGLQTFTGDDVRVCHRLGASPRTPVRPRAVLVRFAQLKTRADVWKLKTALKGSGITMSEFLTRTRHEVFVEARRHFGVKQCWTQEGSVVVQLPDGSRKKVATVAGLKALMDRATAAGPTSAAKDGASGSGAGGKPAAQVSERIRRKPK